MVRILIAAGIRLYREGLEEVLDRYDDFDVVATSSSGPETVEQVGGAHPDVVLLDMAMPGALATMTAIAETRPETRILALAVPESESDVVACAEAGACGFVPREASFDDLVAVIRAALNGELECSSRIANSLRRRVWTLARGPRPRRSAADALTPRQRQILELVDQGLANKEIARRLSIGTSTVKNHVHNILEKLHVEKRGQAAAMVRGSRTRTFP